MLPSPRAARTRRLCAGAGSRPLRGSRIQRGFRAPPCTSCDGTSASTYATELVRDGRSDHRFEERASLARQLAVIPKMLTSLETLTIAGRHHIMEKVIGFTEERVRRASTRISERNRVTLAELVAQLRSEAERPLADPASFSRRAENLVRLLGALG